MSSASPSGVLVLAGLEDYAKDPWYDNRRLPAEYCLRRFNEQIDFAGEQSLFGILEMPTRYYKLYSIRYTIILF